MLQGLAQTAPLPRIILLPVLISSSPQSRPRAHVTSPRNFAELVGPPPHPPLRFSGGIHSGGRGLGGGVWLLPQSSWEQLPYLGVGQWLGSGLPLTPGWFKGRDHFSSQDKDQPSSSQGRAGGTTQHRSRKWWEVFLLDPGGHFCSLLSHQAQRLSETGRQTSKATILFYSQKEVEL